ncbi:MAG TPA: (2Fe-2S)-binding protein [Thermoplasmata archaeon]|nr:(2Fe-2S)-binding protein [Thermoplasmata archaeon]
MTDGRVAFRLNGAPASTDGVPGEERLLDTVRWRLGLKGTKEGCRTGDCGACTVLLDGESVLSCLTLTHEVAGREVTTIEGLERDPIGERVRAALAEEPALQCGYCTPGFVVAIVGRLRERPLPASTAELAEDLQGNLCRCTGYASILRALERLPRPEG